MLDQGLGTAIENNSVFTGDPGLAPEQLIGKIQVQHIQWAFKINLWGIGLRGQRRTHTKHT